MAETAQEQEQGSGAVPSAHPLHFRDVGPRKATLPLDDCPPAMAQQRAFARSLGQKQAISVHALLALTSILGTLARVGIEATSVFPGQAVTFRLLWVQGLGCALMGFFVARRDELEEFYAPLYVALTIGFCGSMTSWSAMMIDVFVEFANIRSARQSRWHSVSLLKVGGRAWKVSWLTVQFLGGVYITLTTFAVIVASVQAGVHLANALPALGKKRPPSRDPFPALRNDMGQHEESTEADRRDDFILPAISRSRTPLPWIDPLFTAVGVASWLAATLLCAFYPPWRGKATFGITFGPIGTFARLWISRWLNSRQAKTRFPLGTLVSNTTSTALYAMAYLLQRTEATQNNVNACAALQGIQDGLSGCLSTISTLVIELLTLPRLNTYLYALSSWCISQCLVLLILGIYAFTKGLSPACIY